MTNEEDLSTSAAAHSDDIAKAASVLLDPSQKIALRFRALFLLRNAGDADLAPAAQAMVDCLLLKKLSDASALLKHECAYCLGQIGATTAVRSFVVPSLYKVLCDPDQPVIARHEAGEALGAIGAVEYLQKFEEIAAQVPSENIPIEIIQTCDLAAARIRHISGDPLLSNKVLVSPFDSVDPAPPEDKDVDVVLLGDRMCDVSKSLFDRYRAMFSLRNIAGKTPDTKLADEAVRQLVRGFKLIGPEEALLRHEVAFVLGQLGGRAENSAVASLLQRLKDSDENPMVRHEAAEALGAVANDGCTPVLKQFATDVEPIVSESCVVALDLAEYERSESFEYATLS